MTIRRIAPPSEFLRAASSTSLQSFELARLNHAANLRREIAALIDQWIQESSDALLARYMLDQRNSYRPSALAPLDNLRVLQGPDPDPLPDGEELASPVPPRFADVLRPLDQSRRQKSGT